MKEKVPDLDLDMPQLAQSVVDEVAKRIPAVLAKAGAQLAAKFVPGAGLAVSLYKGLEWVLNNRTELTAVFDKFKAAIDDVYAATRPGANEGDAVTAVQAKLLAGF